MNNLPKSVTIFEVGPRDGLQNEKVTIPTADKIKFIQLLAETGLTELEVTSFVSPKWVPQLADHAEIFQQLSTHPKVNYWALVPNHHGLAQAIAANVRHIAIFTAASNSFCEKNINCSIEESLEQYQSVINKAIQQKIQVRGYISTAIACPYEGDIAAEVVSTIAKRLYQAGCYQISLGDTTGVATPNQVQHLIETVSTAMPLDAIAVHFHDTYGQALANITTALTLGIKTIDSAVAGLGGCPYAKGATGNVATEDVLYLLQGLGIKTGINLDKVIAAGNYICQVLQQPTRSKVAAAKAANA